MARYERRIGPAEAGQGIDMALQSFAQQLKIAQEREKMQRQNRFMMDTFPEIGQATTQEDALARGFSMLRKAKDYGVTDPSQFLISIGELAKNLPSRKEQEANEAKIKAEGAKEAAAIAQGKESESAEALNKEKLKNERLFPITTPDGVIYPFDGKTGEPNPQYKVESDRQKLNWEIVTHPANYEADDVTKAGEALGLPDVTPYRSALDVVLARKNLQQDPNTPVVITNPDGTLVSTTWHLADLQFKAKIAEIKQAKDNYEPKEVIDNLTAELLAIQEGMANTKPRPIPITNPTNGTGGEAASSGEEWLKNHGYGK